MHFDPVNYDFCKVNKFIKILIMKNNHKSILTIAVSILIINTVYTPAQTSQSISNDNEVYKSFELYQNSPDPFYGITKIKFDVNKKAEILLDVFSSDGEKVANLVSGEMEPGQYSVYFKADESMKEGAYFYVLRQNKSTEIKRMVYKLHK